MENDLGFSALLLAITTQVEMFEKREKSRVEINYGLAMQNSAVVLAKFSRDAPFDLLLMAEKTFQRNDLAVYARLPTTLKTVQQGITDITDGEEVYKQLLEDPRAYKAHKYRESERAAPDKIIPLDAMRRALRGQIKRVENYRKNVMGNAHESEFLSARIGMLRRAEKLYDGIQREHLQETE